MLYIGFNQINSLLCVGTQRGFHVFSTNNYTQKTFHLFKHGGIGIVDVLFTSNIFALVGGGSQPEFPPNKIMIFEDQKKQCIAQLDCPRKVRAVRLHRNSVTAVMDGLITVYNYDLKEIDSFETAPNPKGIFALNADTEHTVLAFPSPKLGTVRLVRIQQQQQQASNNKTDNSKSGESSSSSSATTSTGGSGSGETVTDIEAHKSGISQIALSRDGTRLATASETGTLIRIFDTATGQKLKEVRRGSTTAEIFSIAFSDDSNYLCACSDHGTVHLFAVGGEPRAPNRTSALSFVNYVYSSEWVNSEWSIAECKGIRGPAICCFGSSNNIVKVVNGFGELIKIEFDLEKPNTEPFVSKNRIPWADLNPIYAE